MGVMDRNKLMIVAAFCAALRFGDATGRFLKKYKVPFVFLLGFALGWVFGGAL